MCRIGVYICECGPNIGRTLRLPALVQSTGNLTGVVRVRRVPVLCGREGLDFLGEEIVAQGLDRVVVAGCSPREHESTFRSVLERAGLNPYMLQVANIREQCEWVVRDRDQATGLARRLVAGAVARVRHHEPLLPSEIAVSTDVVVIGAGTAGVRAALTLAGKKRVVHLVERLPCVGGKVPLYEDVFPGMACAACVMDPMLDELLHHDGIRVHLMSSVEELLGFKGNFTVRLLQSPRYVDPEACLGCGACVEACPVRVPDEWNPGLAERRAVAVPYPGVLPSLAVVDPRHCLRWQGEDCRACEEACPFDAVRFEEEARVQEIQAGAVIVATGFDLSDPGRFPQYGYGRLADVITSFELERMLNSSGPTGGRVLRKDGTVPGHAGFVLCVGSRDPRAAPHCSEVCCRYTLKFLHRILAQGAVDRATVFHAGLHLPGGASQDLYRALEGNPSVHFVRMGAPNSAGILEQNGSLAVRFPDEEGRVRSHLVDMAILAPAMEGASGNRELARILHLETGGTGFFDQGITLLDRVEAGREGVFVAGCAAGPTDILGAATGGQAAAGRVLSELVPGETLRLEPVTAGVDETLCSGCAVCEGLCPYGAIERKDDPPRIMVNRVLCRGCGTCAAACPSGAVHCAHFSDGQIAAEVEAMLGREDQGERSKEKGSRIAG
ncbi:MAG: CoB--CoM heterodisulfide reductase iron-sulfur subunit A family protein [Deltaproteobacteria bacterium]|nr:CoB--CoM heterodisulfide reductase iron-sulfur subunit A family protein [Deltaproteobacteria bacterium]